MLLPGVGRPEMIATLAAKFAEDGFVRIEPAFPEATAILFLRALIGSDHAPIQQVDPEHGFQLWRFGWDPGEECKGHSLCELGRWLRGQGASWASAVTGLPLRASYAMPYSDRMRKSAFADAYDAAWSPEALVGVRVHLVTAPWPKKWGGHLELVGAAGRIGRSGPAWNALDLIDLRRVRSYRLPMIDRHVEGFAIASGFER